MTTSQPHALHSSGQAKSRFISGSLTPARTKPEKRQPLPPAGEGALDLKEPTCVEDPKGEGTAAPREPCRGGGDPPGKPAVGRDAPRRPSSVNRTSMGFLLSWWSLLDANCSGGGSSGLPPRPWTITSKPWLLLSSSVHSRTWGAKPVSPRHHRLRQAQRRCPPGSARPADPAACQQRGGVNRDPPAATVHPPAPGAALAAL